MYRSMRLFIYQLSLILLLSNHCNAGSVLAPITFGRTPFDSKYGATFSEVRETCARFMRMDERAANALKVFYLYYIQIEPLYVEKVRNVPKGYLKNCLTAQRMADLFYLSQQYGFNIFELIVKGRTQWRHFNEDGKQILYVFEKNGTGINLYEWDGDQKLEIAIVVRGLYGLNPDYFDRSRGRNIGNFLIKVHLFLLWVLGNMEEVVQISSEGINELQKYYASIGATVYASHWARFKLMGGLDAAILTPEMARFFNERKPRDWRQWSQRKVDEYYEKNFALEDRIPQRQEVKFLQAA